MNTSEGRWSESGQDAEKIEACQGCQRPFSPSSKLTCRTCVQAECWRYRDQAYSVREKILCQQEQCARAVLLRKRQQVALCESLHEKKMAVLELRRRLADEEAQLSRDNSTVVALRGRSQELRRRLPRRKKNLETTRAVVREATKNLEPKSVRLETVEQSCFRHRRRILLDWLHLFDPLGPVPARQVRWPLDLEQALENMGSSATACSVLRSYELLSSMHGADVKDYPLCTIAGVPLLTTEDMRAQLLSRSGTMHECREWCPLESLPELPYLVVCTKAALFHQWLGLRCLSSAMQLPLPCLVSLQTISKLPSDRLDRAMCDAMLIGDACTMAICSQQLKYNPGDSDTDAEQGGTGLVASAPLQNLRRVLCEANPHLGVGGAFTMDDGTVLPLADSLNLQEYVAVDLDEEQYESVRREKALFSGEWEDVTQDIVPVAVGTDTPNEQDEASANSVGGLVRNTGTQITRTFNSMWSYWSGSS